MTTYTLRYCDAGMRALPGSAPLQSCDTLEAAVAALDVEALVHDVTGSQHARTVLQIVITGDEAPDTPGEVLVYFTTCG